MIHISEIYPNFQYYAGENTILLGLFTKRIMQEIYNIEVKLEAPYEDVLAELQNMKAYESYGFFTITDKVTKPVVYKTDVSLEKFWNYINVLIREDMFRDEESGGFTYKLGSETLVYYYYYIIARNACENYKNNTAHKVVIDATEADKSLYRGLANVYIMDTYYQILNTAHIEWVIPQDVWQKIRWEVYCARYMQLGLYTQRVATAKEKENWLVNLSKVQMGDVWAIYNCNKIKEANKTGNINEDNHRVPEISLFAVAIIQQIHEGQGVSLIRVANEHLLTIETLKTNLKADQNALHKYYTEDRAKTQFIPWEDIGVCGAAYNEEYYLCPLDAYLATDRITYIIDGGCYDLSTVEAIYTVLIDRGYKFNIQNYYDNLLKDVLYMENKALPDYNRIKNLKPEYIEH